MVIVAIYGWAKGNPKKFLSPIDNDGKFCGYDDGYGDYPKLYFPDLSSVSNIKNKYVCVKSCPSSTSTVECKTTSTVTNCNDSSYTKYNTKSYLGILCLPVKDELPSNLKDNYDALWSFLDVRVLTQYVHDTAKSWPAILIGLFTALILCIIFMYLVEWCAPILAWICIIGSFSCLTGLGFYFFFTRNKNKDTADDNLSKYNLAWAIICWIAALLLFTLVCCFCKSLRMAIGVVQAAADFITDTKRILLVPICGFVILGVFYALWICVAIYVYTIGEIESTSGQGRTVKWDTTTKRGWYYHFFGLFWINTMLDACTCFIIIVAVCTWYFSHGSEVEGSAQVYKGFKWIFRYHCGSLALGALILAIIQMIRFIFEYFRKKAEAANPANAVLKILLCMVSYCLACLNRCIKFINRNAYIQVALTSVHFCLGAFNAFILILRNAARFTFVEYLAFIFAILGKLLIVSINCLITYIIVETWPYIADNVSSYFPAVLIVGIITYCVCMLFFSVFSIAANTILQCFILDLEISNASGRGSAGHQPPALKKFIKQVRRDKGEKVSDSDQDQPPPKDHAGNSRNMV